MSIRLSDLGKETKTVPVLNQDGNTLFNITYRLDFYTAEVEAFISSLSSDDAPIKNNIEIIASILTDWDIVDEDENPTKPTVEMLSKPPFGSSLLQLMMSAITAGSSPNETASSKPDGS